MRRRARALLLASACGCGPSVAVSEDESDGSEGASTDEESASDESGEPSAGCGDGVVDVGEDCDDGNSRHGDGCNIDCRVSGQETGHVHLDDYTLSLHSSPARGLEIVGDSDVVYARELRAPEHTCVASRHTVTGELTWTTPLVDVDCRGVRSAMRDENVILGASRRGFVFDGWGLYALDGMGLIELLQEREAYNNYGILSTDVAVTADAKAAVLAWNYADNGEPVTKVVFEPANADVVVAGRSGVALTPLSKARLAVLTHTDVDFLGAGTCEFSIVSELGDPAVTYDIGLLDEDPNCSFVDIVSDGHDLITIAGDHLNANLLAFTGEGELRWRLDAAELVGLDEIELRVTSLAVAPEGDVLMVGEVGPDPSRVVVARLTPDGGVRWLRWIEPMNGGEQTAGVIAASADVVWVAGILRNQTAADDVTWLKAFTP